MIREEFYTYIRRRMGLLLAWGVSNVLAGSVLGLLKPDKFWRQFWLQCAGWGAVDALIAWLARRGYAKKLATPADGEGLKKDVRNIYLILLVNVFLDAGYMLTGQYFRRKGQAESKPEKSGLGLGFIGQGLFLFLFDGFLTLEIRRRWLKKVNQPEKA